METLAILNEGSRIKKELVRYSNFMEVLMIARHYHFLVRDRMSRSVVFVAARKTLRFLDLALLNILVLTLVAWGLVIGVVVYLN